MNWVWFHKLASPPHGYRIARQLRPWLFWSSITLMSWAAYEALFVVPPDYQQDDGYRILFVHVPAATMSTVTYTAMATAAAIGSVWRMKLAHASDTWVWVRHSMTLAEPTELLQSWQLLASSTFPSSSIR